MSAAYAFYKITMAIINLVKAKAAMDPIVQTIRNIGFVDALTSMLVLESRLISTFGSVDIDMRRLISISSISVCVFVVALGSYMVIRGIKKLNMRDNDPPHTGSDPQ